MVRESGFDSMYGSTATSTINDLIATGYTVLSSVTSTIDNLQMEVKNALQTPATYVYDVFGRLVDLTTQLLKSTFSPDTDGNREKTEVNNSVTEERFDAENRAI